MPTSKNLRLYNYMPGMHLIHIVRSTTSTTHPTLESSFSPDTNRLKVPTRPVETLLIERLGQRQASPRSDHQLKGCAHIRYYGVFFLQSALFPFNGQKKRS